MAPSESVDLSVIVNIFREGRLIHPTLRSLSNAVQLLVDGGFSAEVILVLDRTDAKTLDYIDEYVGDMFLGADVRQLYVQNGDLGLSRNSGVAFSRGRFIAFSDDDNLYSVNWLLDSVRILDAETRDVVLHPDAVVNFEAKSIIWRSTDSESPDVDLRAMVEQNRWDAACIAPRRAFEQIPYVATLSGPGFGPEDWHWNAQSLNAGWVHRPTPETVLFYRVKASGSLLVKLDGYLLPRTELLSNPRPGLMREPQPVDEAETEAEIEAVVEPEPAPEPPAAPRRPLKSRAIGVTRRGVKATLRPLRRLERLHPRLERFSEQVRPAVVALLAPPQRPAPLPPQPEAVVAAPVIVEPVVETPAGEPDAIPTWVIDAWRSAHEIEPALFPIKEMLETILRWAPDGSYYTDLYWTLLPRLMPEGTAPDYLLLVPWMLTGGGTSVSFNYVRAIREREPDATIVVLSTLTDATEDYPSDDPKVTYAHVPSDFYWLEHGFQDRLLATLIVQIAPRNVHVINSPVGFRAFASYGKLLSVNSKLFVSAFTLDETPEGRRVHYILDAIRSYVDYLSGIFVDNSHLVDVLADTFALPRSKFFVHYQPLDPAVVELAGSTSHEAPAEGKRLSVIWAARLDRQKRPDLLVAVSTRSRELGLPIDFYASGEAVLDREPNLVQRILDSGVKFLGRYQDSIASIDQRFDVLLLTSQWEGLPLTLLDSAVNDITIVASDVGGVRDFVTEGETGYLVAPFDDVEAYIAILSDLAANREKLVATRAPARELAQSRHSWSEFVTHVRDSAGYVS